MRLVVSLRWDLVVVSLLLVSMGVDVLALLGSLLLLVEVEGAAWDVVSTLEFPDFVSLWPGEGLESTLGVGWKSRRLMTIP